MKTRETQTKQQKKQTNKQKKIFTVISRGLELDSTYLVIILMALRSFELALKRALWGLQIAKKVTNYLPRFKTTKYPEAHQLYVKRANAGPNFSIYDNEFVTILSICNPNNDPLKHLNEVKSKTFAIKKVLILKRKQLIAPREIRNRCLSTYI